MTDHYRYEILSVHKFFFLLLFDYERPSTLKMPFLCPALPFCLNIRALSNLSPTFNFSHVCLRSECWGNWVGDIRRKGHKTLLLCAIY